jgi:hypothetical protein
MEGLAGYKGSVLRGKCLLAGRPAGATFGRNILERETGFEPATSTLARSHSTAELLPLDFLILIQFRLRDKFASGGYSVPPVHRLSGPIICKNFS